MLKIKTKVTRWQSSPLNAEELLRQLSYAIKTQLKVLEGVFLAFRWVFMA